MLRMKNTKCYGRKKVIIPKEKSFITNFFDGNESSDLATKSSDYKDQEASASTDAYREKMYHLFDSSKLFTEDSLCEQKKRSCLKSVAKPNDDKDYSSENKENVCNLFESPVLHSEESFSVQKKTFGIRNVPIAKEAPKSRLARKKNVRKNGIQHLSTKYCKSLQPCWDEFEKHDLNIERQGKTNHPIVIEQSINSERSKNIENHTINLSCTSTANNFNSGESSQIFALPHKTLTTPKNIKTKPKLRIFTEENHQSSGELFSEIHKYKTNMKMKNNKTKMKKSRKKYDKFSYQMGNKLEEKINKCMQNVDLFERCSKNVNCYSESSNFKEKASNVDAVLPSDSALEETVPIQCSKTISKASNVDNILLSGSVLKETVCFQSSETVLHGEIIPKSKGFCDTTDKTFEKNQESGSTTEVHCISLSNGYSKNLMHKTKENIDEYSTYSEQKLPQAFINNNHSHNNFLPNKCIDLCRDKNVADDVSKKAAFHNSNVEIGSDKSQEMLPNSLRILRSMDTDVPHKLMTRNISGNIVHTNENEQNNIMPELSERKKINDSISSIALLHKSKYLGKSSAIPLNRNVDSLNLAEKTLKKSVHKNSRSKSHTLSPNVSNVIQNCKSVGLKRKGKFITSTPVTNRIKAHDFFRAEMMMLSDDEKLYEPKIYPNRHSSSCEKTKEINYLKSIETEKLKNSSIDCLNESASIEIPKSLQSPATQNLLKSRTSLTVLSKNVVHSETRKNSQSLLNLSHIDPSSENEKSNDFTKAKLLELCDQVSVTPFAEIYDWKNFKVKKIGEGTYGEVFMLSKNKTFSVLKVIAISEDPNAKNLQGLSSVYSEIKISKSLSELRCNQINQSKNFVKVIRSSVVCGLYPDALMKAWDDFRLDRSTYNYRPDIYSESQLFVILELEYGGNDMSCITLRNGVEAEIILKQIAVSLAVAEEEFSFEHRDLHLGNILVKRNRSKKVSYKIRGKNISFQSLGLQVTIIDFTLSLLSDKGYIYYYDLAEDSLFDQTGDYQFDVYKSMRKHLENKWEECSLYSNVLWLKYFCKKLKEFKYTHPTAVTHKRGLKAIDSFNTQLMKCSCALECLEKCGITKTVFKRSMSDTTRNSVLVSRNSIQKSKLSLCN